MVSSYTDKPVPASNSSEIDACTKLADNLTNHSGASNSGEIEAGTMLADNLTSQSDASNSGEIDAVQSWQTISLIILMS